GEVPPAWGPSVRDDRDGHRFAQVFAVGLEVLAGVIAVAPGRARLVQPFGTLNIGVVHETDSFPSARCRPASIEPSRSELGLRLARCAKAGYRRGPGRRGGPKAGAASGRSEEHTSELQSRFDLVCRLLL